jgi:hypothetical protein
VDEVVARLAAFRPTRIAVEWPRERQAALDSLYREYRAGRLAPRPSEVFQLGFRLAARLGLARVDAVDVERHQALIDAVTPRERDLVAADSRTPGARATSGCTRGRTRSRPRARWPSTSAT